MESLLLLYASKKADIKKRLAEFDKVKYEPDERIFAELAFCLCTPQTRASSADRAVQELMKTGLLFGGTERQLSEALRSNGVRFHNNKARYIIKARERFSRNKKIKIKSMINTEDIQGLRSWLAENITGLGYKEASHFLRNIGYGRNIIILDRHILNSLSKYKIISEIPKSLSKGRYMGIESKARGFAKKLNITLAELDMLWWSEQGSLPLESMK